MNKRLKGAIITKFGSQIEAARALKISEARLSRIIREWDEPKDNEKAALKRVLGESHAG